MLPLLLSEAAMRVIGSLIALTVLALLVAVSDVAIARPAIAVQPAWTEQTMSLRERPDVPAAIGDSSGAEPTGSVRVGRPGERCEPRRRQSRRRSCANSNTIRAQGSGLSCR